MGVTYINDNNDNNYTERRDARFLSISLQHRSTGRSAIVCKSRATHRALITCKMSCATLYEGTTHVHKFDKVETTFIFSFVLLVETTDR